MPHNQFIGELRREIGIEHVAVNAPERLFSTLNIAVYAPDTV